MLGPKLKTTAKVYNSVQDAQAEAKLLSESDADWSYIVEPDPLGSGRAVIRIYDEDGEFVETWGS